MKLTISKEVFNTFHPDFAVIFLRVNNIHNQHLRESRHLVQEMEEEIRRTHHPDTIKNHYLISPWVAAQQAFGQVSHYQTSVERILQQVLRKKTVVTNHTLGNIMRYLMLKYLVPMSADDCQKVRGNITFAIAKGGEKISFSHSLVRGALYYHDSKRVLGTKLDHWKNPVTRTTPHTTQALVHLGGLPPLTLPKLLLVAEEAQQLLETFCGTTVKKVQVHRRKATVMI